MHLVKLYGKSFRKKHTSLKKVIYVFLLGSLPVITILFLLSFYSPWLSYTYPNAAKWWFPPLPELWKRGFTTLLNNNLASITNVLMVSEPSLKSSIPTVDLWLPDNGMEKFNKEILMYAFSFQSKKPRLRGLARIENDMQFLPANIIMRGVHNDHHQIWKPSLRISFKKTGFPNGFKNHIIIAPRDEIGFQNWISQKLGDKWNIISPQEHFVRLFINRKYFGLYTRAWRLDESLLIKNNRLPGPFFRNEYSVDRKYKRKYVKWFSPIGWNIKGSDLIEGRKKIKTPAELGKNIIDKGPTNNLTRRKLILDNYQKFNEYFNVESFAKFLAILCYAGETHVDDIHNNAFWLDVYSGKFFPVLIDPGGMRFGLNNRNLYRPIIKSKGAFILPWLSNPYNLSIYIEKLYELINNLGLPKNVASLIKNTWKKIRRHSISDINVSKSGCSARCNISIFDLDSYVNRLIQFLELRTQWIQEQLSFQKMSLVNLNNNQFEIIINGFAGIKIKRKDKKAFKVNGINILSDQFNLIPSINSQKLPSLKKRFPIPDAYAFYTLSGKPNDYKFYHRLNFNELNFSKAPKNLSLLKNFMGINPLEFPEIDKKPITIGPGEVLFQQTKEYNEGQTVNIKAGTYIKLGPGVSLIIRGRLFIEGNKSEPVIIRPLIQEKPFGVLALFGKKTRESRIHFLNIKGGSVHQRFNTEFTGMVSIHDCPDIEIHNSVFGKNFIGDDAVHLVRSKALIMNSVFEDALSDAMDWDKVNGQVKNSIFRNSGNDGLDLSMGSVIIENTRFENSRDKCISAGEGTKTKVTETKFLNCNVGIAVKDRSHVLLEDSLFSRSRVAYHSFRKKWRWEKGGDGIIRNTQFLNSIDADIKGDKRSQVKLQTGIPSKLRILGEINIVSPSIDDGN